LGASSSGKSDAFDQAQQLFKKIQIEQNYSIMRIHNDHGIEFENSSFKEFCNFHGIFARIFLTHHSPTEWCRGAEE
jgi:hypothetical protein